MPRRSRLDVLVQRYEGRRVLLGRTSFILKQLITEEEEENKTSSLNYTIDCQRCVPHGWT